jgi:hypothetical protein
MFYLNDYGQYGDFLWDSTYITIWYVDSWSFTNSLPDTLPRTTVEICVAIIAASAYALKPLFQAILKDRTTHSNGYSNRYASKKFTPNSSAAQRIRIHPDLDSSDVELGSHPSRHVNHTSSSSHSSSQFQHEDSSITKTTDLAVFVSARRPSDDQTKTEEPFEYDSRHH